jgi:hypothetical protein
MSRLDTARSILQGETLHAPRGVAAVPLLVADYTWYSLEELTRRHAADVRQMADVSASMAYNQAVSVAQSILRAQGGTHYYDAGRKEPEEHLGLHVGDYVTWDNWSGRIKELDSFGWAFVSVRIKEPNGKRGHQVSIRIKRNKLQRLTLD